MESDKNISAEEDNDATLVTPRFDSGEAETAQPVVPLAAVSGEAETYDAPQGFDAPAYAPRPSRRASLPLALVLVSALAGSVFGGAALYFFQKSRQQRPAPTETARPAVGVDASAQTEPAPETEPAPSPTPEEAAAVVSELPAEVAVVEDAGDAEDRKVPDAKREDDDDGGDDDSRVTRARPSVAPPAAPVKQGKKGERENDGDENNRATRDARPRRVTRPEPSEDEEYYEDRSGARRVGSIVYGREERRQRRRQRREPAVDRVRGIFEGQP